MTKVPHFDDTNTGRFVTFNCYRNIQAFQSDLAKRLFIEELSALRTRLLVLIYGYVIMLEHAHLVLHPTSNTPMSRIVRELKSLSARRYFAESGVRPTGETGIFWQPGYYDYNCRTREDILQKVEYCHNTRFGEDWSVCLANGSGRVTIGFTASEGYRLPWIPLTPKLHSPWNPGGKPPATNCRGMSALEWRETNPDALKE